MLEIFYFFLELIYSFVFLEFYFFTTGLLGFLLALQYKLFGVGIDQKDDSSLHCVCKGNIQGSLSHD